MKKSHQAGGLLTVLRPPAARAVPAVAQPRARPVPALVPSMGRCAVQLQAKN